jgi:beta-galactosidase/beta-glucuronidase
MPEWLEELERDRNHPAIIGWCPFNETWDVEGRPQYPGFLKTVYRITKAVDPSRPCIDTSGNYHVVTDIYDIHDYDQNVETFKARFDEDFLKAFDKFKQYSPDFVEISEKRCRFTDRGMFVSNAILSNVLDFGE